MKDQYTADINDYIKYSILRAVQRGHDASVLVAWMLTAQDDRSDGARTGYLDRPEEYRDVDAPLFDSLQTLVGHENRSTQAIQASGILQGATFLREPLTDSPESRDAFLRSIRIGAPRHRTVFLDPDNGLSVKSVKAGGRGARRYVFDSELEAIADAGASVIVYQHLPRVQRTHYLTNQLDRLELTFPGYTMSALYTSSVAFLLGWASRDARGLRLARDEVLGRWDGRLILHS